jgi:hypothetical protein
MTSENSLKRNFRIINCIFSTLNRYHLMSLQIILVNCINFGFYLMHIVIGRIGLICIIPLIATQILTYFLHKYYNIQMTMNALHS